MVRLSHAVASPADGCRLRIEGLTLRRGRTPLVVDASVEHRPGGIAWVVGENGAGKSSLLAVLAGRRAPYAGRIHRGVPTGRPVCRAYYHPGMRLPRGGTIADWNRLLASLGAPVRTRSPSADLVPAGLPSDRRLGRLSTGQEKRIILAALLRRPSPFTILDEPYEHLSPDARRTLTTVLEQRARTGIVVVATNRDLSSRARVIWRLDGDRLTPYAPDRTE